MSLGHQVGVQTGRQVLGRSAHYARLSRLGFRELQVKAAFQVSQAGQVLIQTITILGSEFLAQFPGVVEYRRQRTLAHHDFGVRRKFGGVGVLETLAKQPLVKT